MRGEYFHIDKQNELVEYYNKTIVPLQNELNKEKRSLIIESIIWYRVAV